MNRKHKGRKRPNANPSFHSLAPLSCLLIFMNGAVVLRGETAKPEKAASAEQKACSPEVTFQLAKKLMKGDGMPKDLSRAFELMKEAAKEGHPEAAGGVGLFYRNGWAGVAKDDVEAAKWFRKGAGLGGLHAGFNYGQMLVNGIGVEVSVEEGLSRVEQAAEAGLPEAGLAMGAVYYFGKHGRTVDYGKAFPYFLRSAEGGNPDAQNIVGVMFQNGLGQERNEAKAIEWYRKAADQNVAKAQANLGKMLGTTGGEKENRLEALMWTVVAANQGEITAAVVLRDIQPSVDKAELEEAKRRAGEFRLKMFKRKSGEEARTVPPK
jgi:TPR repeat protein